MAVSGTFRILINGKPLSIGTEIKLKERASRMIIKIDPMVKLEERNFARLEYTYEWTGVPRNFGDANAVLKFLTESVGQYFRDWTTDIKMQLIEDG